MAFMAATAAGLGEAELVETVLEEELARGEAAESLGHYGGGGGGRGGERRWGGRSRGGGLGGPGQALGVPTPATLPVLKSSLAAEEVARSRNVGVRAKVVEPDGLTRLDISGGAERHNAAVTKLQSLDGAVGRLAAGVVDEPADTSTGTGVHNIEWFLGARLLVLHGVGRGSEAQRGFAEEPFGLGHDLPSVGGDDSARRDGARGEEELSLVRAMSDLTWGEVLEVNGPICALIVPAGVVCAHDPPEVGAPG